MRGARNEAYSLPYAASAAFEDNKADGIISCLSGADIAEGPLGLYLDGLEGIISERLYKALKPLCPAIQGTGHLQELDRRLCVLPVARVHQRLKDPGYVRILELIRRGHEGLGSRYDHAAGPCREHIEERRDAFLPPEQEPLGRSEPVERIRVPLGREHRYVLALVRQALDHYLVEGLVPRERYRVDNGLREHPGGRVFDEERELRDSPSRVLPDKVIEEHRPLFPCHGPGHHLLAHVRKLFLYRAHPLKVPR